MTYFVPLKSQPGQPKLQQLLHFCLLHVTERIRQKVNMDDNPFAIWQPGLTSCVLAILANPILISIPTASGAKEIANLINEKNIPTYMVQSILALNNYLDSHHLQGI